MTVRAWIRGLVAAFCLLVGTAAATPPQKGVSLDDILAMEGFGSAAASPDGSWIVYEKLRPYQEADDFSFRTYAFGKSGHQVWRYDLKARSAPELLPNLDQKPHTYIESFSPTGRFLAIFQYRFGALSLAAYDMEKRQVRTFSQGPAFSRDGEHVPVWLSDTEIVYAALPDGILPAASSVRAYAGQRLSTAWTAAWRGKTVTATESRTVRASDPGKQQAGALVRANAETGITEILASGLFAGLRVSPDRRWLAALAVWPGTAGAGRHTLVVFDLETGASVPAAPGIEFSPYSLEWSADSRRIAGFGWRPGERQEEGRFHIVNTVDGEVERLEHFGLDLVSERERGGPQRPERAVFLGGGLAVFARKNAVDGPYSARFPPGTYKGEVLARPDWYLLEAASRPVNLTAGLPAVSGVPINADKDHLTVTAANGIHRIHAGGKSVRLGPVALGSLVRVEPGSFTARSGLLRPDNAGEALFALRHGSRRTAYLGEFGSGGEPAAVEVDLPPGTSSILTGTRTGKAVLVSLETDGAAQLAIARPSGWAVLAEINRHLLGLDPGSWQTVSYDVPVAGGGLQRIDSCVLFPPGHMPGRPLAVIIEVYPNTSPNCLDGPLRLDYPDPVSPYLWAGRGYAYARLTLPRNLLRTQAGPIAGMPALVEAGIGALVAKGIADPDRLALFGFSQGGVSSLYVAAHSERFKAVIAVNSWSDLFSHHFGGLGIYSYVYGDYYGADAARYATPGSDFGIGRTPFEDPEAYYRNSPLWLAPQIVAPVMLVHSDMDAFAMAQFDEMFGALSAAGKDARYIRYFGEGHLPSSPANVRDFWQRMDAFLAEHGAAPTVACQIAREADVPSCDRH